MMIESWRGDGGVGTSTEFECRYAKGHVHQILREVALERLRTSGRTVHGGLRVWVAVFPALLWFYATLGLLLFVHLSPAWVVVCTVSLGLAVTANFTVVHHTALHQALVRSRRVNWAIAYLAAPLAISSRWWTAKHNEGHHAFTNVEGLDGDVSQGSIVRLHSLQPLRRWHRYQHLYVWALYPFVGAAMALNGDRQFILFGRLKGRKVRDANAVRTLVLTVEKFGMLPVFLALGFAFHPAYGVLAVLAGVFLVAGTALAAILAPTHYVEEVEFPVPDGGAIASEWAVTQVLGAANVRLGNPLLRWYFGGLNQHIEHHLFPRIAHVHLRSIAPGIKATCEDLGLPYHELPNLRAAFASHYRFLRELGREAAVASSSVERATTASPAVLQPVTHP